WRACLRFADIDAPVSVQVGRKINFDAGQTAGLIACTGSRATEAQPAAGNEQTFAAVDVEALTCSPAAGTPGGLIFRLVCIPVPVREDIRSDCEGRARMANTFRRQLSRRR